MLNRTKYQLSRPKKKYRLRRWVIDTLFFVLGVMVTLLINQIINDVNDSKFTLQNYECIGRTYKICWKRGK